MRESPNSNEWERCDGSRRSIPAKSTQRLGVKQRTNNRDIPFLERLTRARVAPHGSAMDTGH